MQFKRIIGKIDQALIERAEKALSKVFLELGLSPVNNHVTGSMGGDPLIFTLVYPMQHVATRNIPTAGTDGKRYYWNPKFVVSKSRLGLRLVCMHEAWHAIYMHPTRRKKRDPRLWNIAVDYIVNGAVMASLKNRKLDPVAVFTKELGNFCTLDQYIDHIKDPKKKIKGSEHWSPEPLEDSEEIILPKVDDDRELTDKEKKEIEKREAKIRYFFADPNLPEDMKRPEKIYDLLYRLMPKCPECGRLGVYPSEKAKDNNEENDKHKKSGEQEKSSQDSREHNDNSESCDNHSSNDHDHSNDHGNKGNPSEGSQSPSTGGDTGEGGSEISKSNQPRKPCSTCKGGYDIFGDASTLDDHMDAEESPEKTAKRLADAFEASRQMAGSIPGELLDELNELTAPKIRWQDFLRAKISRTRDGNAKNDWSRFKTRPLFAGLFLPKKVNQICTFGCLLDTSGSMSKNDMTFGVSQLQSIDQKSEGWIVPADASIYWKEVTKLKKVNAQEISKVKVMGRGGTKYAEFFRDYQKEVGKVDFLIMITDGGLLDQDIAEMIDPGIDVIWLITNASFFKAPFGRVFNLID